MFNRVCYSLAGDLEILGFLLNTEKSSSLIDAGDPGCSATHERVHDCPAALREPVYDQFHEFQGFGAGMGLFAFGTLESDPGPAMNSQRVALRDPIYIPESF